MSGFPSPSTATTSPGERRAFTSDDVFYFKADPSPYAFDSCVTGMRQEAMSDGFYLMFKPLPPGEHVIVVNAHDMNGVPVTLTDRLTVR